MHAAAQAFDSLAPEYDATFTHSVIGRAQRNAVLQYASEVFTPGSRLLELNCGTGEDALHFAQHGFRVTACDASPAMVMEARKKAANKDMAARLRFYVQPTERIGELLPKQQFGCVFSNFSGLNCVEDLRATAHALAPLLSARAPMLLCVSTRYCLWEIIYYLLRRQPTRALRRCRGSHETNLGGISVPVYYPTSASIERSFSPAFRLVSIKGIGITVPPSYLESWMKEHLTLLRVLERTDNWLQNLPLLRTLGDHMLLHFERSLA
jgi:SAM-dependent methyltransferase